MLHPMNEGNGGGGLGVNTLSAQVPFDWKMGPCEQVWTFVRLCPHCAYIVNGEHIQG